MDNTTQPTTAASFVGTWKLVSFTQTLVNGALEKPMGENPHGYLVYTAEGIVSAQLASSGNYQTELVSADALANAETGQGGASYISYCGTFAVHSDQSEVIHLPQIAHDRTLIGRALHRKFNLEADRLTLTTVNKGDVLEAQLVWHRYYHV